MRYDVKKFLFIGLKEDRDSFFRSAQNAGFVHFIESSTRGKEVPQEVANLIAAIKVLRGLPVMPQEDLPDYALADGLANKIMQLKHRHDHLTEEQRISRLEIERISVFGDFSLDDQHWIEKEGKRKIQFFFSKHGAHTELPEDVIYVGTQHELDYFVGISPEPIQVPKLIEMRIDHALGTLQKRYQENGKEILDLEHRLKAYEKYNTFLHHALTNKLNTVHLQQAKENVDWPLDENLFSVQGWVPVTKEDDLHKLVEEKNVHTAEISIEHTDKVPTYLENEGAHRIGEDLVHIYDTPSTTDKDPSLWVLVAFSFFFAFIVGDGGYGLIFLAAALYLRYKFPDLFGVKKRVLNLVTIICFACIGWGLLTNSFFGISFAPDSPIRRYSLIEWLIEKKTAYHIAQHDDVYDYWVKKFPKLEGVTNPEKFVTEASTKKDGNVTYELMNKFSDNIMMEMALTIGVIHVILSLCRYLTRNWVNLGWIAFIIGAYLYIPHYLQATTMMQYLFGINREQAAMNGVYLLSAGLVLAVTLSIIKHKLLGLTEVMNVIQVFADIMSYLRLYALAMAGSIVMATINETVGVLPAVASFALLIVGHAVNMLLAIMGGIIHGLRLNFLEWYRYSFEGGGKPFKPLQKLRIK